MKSTISIVLKELLKKKEKNIFFSDGDQGSGRIKRQRRNKGEFFSIEIAFEQNLFHVNVVIIS